MKFFYSSQLLTAQLSRFVRQFLQMHICASTAPGLLSSTLREVEPSTANIMLREPSRRSRPETMKFFSWFNTWQSCLCDPLHKLSKCISAFGRCRGHLVQGEWQWRRQLPVICSGNPTAMDGRKR
jgi:hypothetical protein